MALNEPDEKEKLKEFLESLDEYTPAVPNALVEYYLKRTGFNCDDERVQKLIGLAAQKFISDIATDSMHFCKIRQQSAPSKEKKSQQSGRDKKYSLQVEDLAASLEEYGITIRKPEYYSDGTKTSVSRGNK
eukprot:gb/GECH01012448.1/.p1 GENE.gb/GECH01012448.1/~~gb/GECH01012448.1/.p1  ORF type:complete len:131 (+),score=34.04 gb/GECH01012448.1/:1-393(+)